MRQKEIQAAPAAAQARIADLAAQQAANSGFLQNCPRCGLPRIKPRLLTNALGRHADIHVCDACGNEEALEDKDGTIMPLGDWAAIKPGFALLPKDGTAVVMLPSDLPCGTECWAWQYEWPQGMSLPTARMLPVRGILAHTNQEIGTDKQAPGWFVPYAKGSKKPAWTRSVRAECVNLHTGKTDAQAAFSAAVAAVAARFDGLARLARNDLAELPGPLHATAAVAGKASGDGFYGWAAVVITAGTTSVVSGCGKDGDADDYRAAVHALDFAARHAAMMGVSRMRVWSDDGDITSGLGYIAASGGPLLAKPDGDPDMKRQMRAFLDQAADMAAQQLRHVRPSNG